MTQRTWEGSSNRDPEKITKKNFEPSIFLGFTLYDRFIKGTGISDPLAYLAVNIQLTAFQAAYNNLPSRDEMVDRGTQVLAEYESWKNQSCKNDGDKPDIYNFANNRLGGRMREPIPDAIAGLYEVYLAFAVVDRAVEFLNNGQRELAAIHLIEASRLLPNTDIRHPVRELAASGGNAKNNAYAPLRDMARRLAAEGKYSSRRNAALSIAETILQTAPQYGLRLSEQQAERTITGWLKGMVFTSKHRTPSGTK